MDNLNGIMILAILFSFGSLLGWCIELIFRRFSTDNKERIWINPGFLMGPCLPLYGFALTMLFLITYSEQYIKIENTSLRRAAIFGLMALGITLVELVAGEIFILRRHLKLWDYSDMRFNYKGILCVRYTLYWTGLGMIYYYFVHPHILGFLDWASQHQIILFLLGIFYGILFVDVAYSFELTSKIKSFAVENRMVIRYEELKKHIYTAAKQQTERYVILRAAALTNSIKEALTGYLVKQKEQAKHGKQNDFIDSEIEEPEETETIKK